MGGSELLGAEAESGPQGKRGKTQRLEMQGCLGRRGACEVAGPLLKIECVKPGPRL